MDIIKTVWQADPDNFRFTVPFQKVDTENRVVSGWATLDNLDKHGDVVLKEASDRAFSRWIGNIREMHQPIAAGKLVSFKSDSFYNPDDQQFYNGVWVDAYVSKGAQDTWEKVLDGTLTGFSIGGEIRDQESEWVKDATGGGKTVRFIKDYELIELSLVDNPANPLANVLTIQKSASGELMFKGLAAEVEMINVFWCSDHKIAKYTKSETADCSQCKVPMSNIGWFESADDNEKQVEAVVQKFLGISTEEVETGKGGVEMAKKETEEVETTEVPQETVAIEKSADEAADEAVEGAETAAVEEEVATPVDEVNTDVPDFEKMAAGLREDLESLLEKAEKTTADAVEPLQEKLVEFHKSFEDKSSELGEQITKLSERIDGLESRSEEVQKRLEVLDGDTAVKKSGDVESPEKLEKSDEKTEFWGGAFTPIGYKSVDDL